MDDEQIVDIWTSLKEYLDKKHVEMAAEKYVDLMADYGVGDDQFQDALGADDNLDKAIQYYLDEESEEEDY